MDASRGPPSAAQHLVSRSRRDQGFEDYIEDEAVLARIGSALLAASDRTATSSHHTRSASAEGKATADRALEPIPRTTTRRPRGNGASRVNDPLDAGDVHA